MKTENQEARRREIEDAAYEVLANKGYKATSMLAIAKRASASNETLYKWYGNKQTLFRSLVEENARAVQGMIQKSLAGEADPLEAIRGLGPVLLRLVTGPKAVTLNRAVVGDVHETGTLRKTLAQAGKGAVAPQIALLFLKAQDQGLMNFDEPEDVAEIYLNLLIGDLQILRVTGVREALEETEIARRAARAFDLICRLYGPDKLSA